VQVDQLDFVPPESAAFLWVTRNSAGMLPGDTPERVDVRSARVSDQRAKERTGRPSIVAVDRSEDRCPHVADGLRSSRRTFAHSARQLNGRRSEHKDLAGLGRLNRREGAPETVHSTAQVQYTQPTQAVEIDAEPPSLPPDDGQRVPAAMAVLIRARGPVPASR
jgi:hypothetical protein